MLLCSVLHFIYCNTESHYAEWRCYTECHYAECHYAECHYAECHYDKCHYVECHCDECHCDECHYAECHCDECHHTDSHGALMNNPTDSLGLIDRKKVALKQREKNHLRQSLSF